jgi:hypothetical protein
MLLFMLGILTSAAERTLQTCPKLLLNLAAGICGY